MKRVQPVARTAIASTQLSKDGVHVDLRVARAPDHFVVFVQAVLGQTVLLEVLYCSNFGGRADPSNGQVDRLKVEQATVGIFLLARIEIDGQQTMQGGIETGRVRNDVE